jgi:hypothetical protein
MNSEESLQFMRERLRHNHSPLHKELLRREPKLVRRRFAIRLGQGEHHTLDPVDPSVLVCCSEGSLWITHDGDPKDVIIGGGEHYWAEREDAMHLYALQACVLEIQFDDDVVEH